MFYHLYSMLCVYMQNRSIFATEEKNLTKMANVFILSSVIVSCQYIKRFFFSAHPKTGNSCASTFSNTSICAESVSRSSIQPRGKAVQIMGFSSQCQFLKTALQRAQCRCRHKPEMKGFWGTILPLPLHRGKGCLRGAKVPGKALPAPQRFFCASKQ